jgi:hypothetical protein
LSNSFITSGVTADGSPAVLAADEADELVPLGLGVALALACGLGEAAAREM